MDSNIEAMSAALARAREYLNAIIVATDRYVYREPRDGSPYYVLSGADLVRLGGEIDVSDSQEQHACALRWLSSVQRVEMPAWWTPEQPVVVRTPGLDYHYHDVEVAQRAWRGQDSKWTVIVADLETGDEVRVTTGSDAPARRGR